MLIPLKNIRKQAGLRQDEIAQAVGVSRSTVAMWETSAAYPKAETMYLLADLLNCSIDELYGRETANSNGTERSSA